MEIGKKLKKARLDVNLNQEEVAEKIQVSRQTISNWENEKSYPDIMSIIKLSELYLLSLDQLLKGDQQMIAHLKESTDVVKSNKKLIVSIGVNVVLFILMILFGNLISKNNYLMVGIMSFLAVSMSVLFYQIIRRF